MQQIKEYQNTINLFLQELLGNLKENENLDQKLLAALNYVIEQGGKRVRSSLVLYLSDSLGIDPNESIIAAAALELIHNYSLVHDDLPGMDNDLIRRGMPTCHVKFGEGIAILTGTGLLTLALQLLVDGLAKDKKFTILQLILDAISINGLLTGQAFDLKNKKEPIKDPLKLINLYYLKTGKLFELSFTIPAILASLPPEKQDNFSEAGGLLGILYQLSDDLSDKELSLEPHLIKTMKESLLDNYNKAVNALSLPNRDLLDSLVPIEKLLLQI
jgi:geranylgeranyl diphosphate synthase type II